MLLCEYTFEPKREGDLEATEAAVQRLVVALRNNGQIWGDEVVGLVDGAVRVVLGVPRRDALESQHNSEWVAAAESRVCELCVERPVWRVVDDRASKVEPETWREGDSFYLFTHVFDLTSPVRSGSDGQPVPLYLLDLEQKVSEATVGWARAYRAHDEVQLGCGALEIAAYAEMATPDSELARSGRELCGKIEDSTGRRTYYYLVRHWGREHGEAHRPCPGCGHEWATPSIDGAIGLAGFDFRCEPCRLISHIGLSLESVEAAVIGEWRQ